MNYSQQIARAVAESLVVLYNFAMLWVLNQQKALIVRIETFFVTIVWYKYKFDGFKKCSYSQDFSCV